MTDNPQPAEKPKLHWYQYRLWHLFALMTVAAIGCSWFTCKLQKANKRKEAVEVIEDAGGMVAYDYEAVGDGYYVIDAEPPGPAWFRNLVGVEFLSDVVAVYLTDARVSDAGLEHIKELANLRVLHLDRTQVTDAGLEHLVGLTELRKLHIGCTQVTDEGVKKLQQALPNCMISH